MTDSEIPVEIPVDERADTPARSPFERMVASIRDSAGVGTLYGEPIERGDRTVVPVARVAYGFGGGSGEGEDGSGFGGGGGVSARPAGALEVTDDGTRFVRYGNRRKLLGAAAAGFLLGLFFGRRRD